MSFLAKTILMLIATVYLGGAFGQSHSYNQRMSVKLDDGDLAVRSSYLTYHAINYKTSLGMPGYTIIEPLDKSLVDGMFSSYLKDKSNYEPGSLLPNINFSKLKFAAKETKIPLKGELGSSWKDLTYEIKGASLQGLKPSALADPGWDYPQIVLFLNILKGLEITADAVNASGKAGLIDENSTSSIEDFVKWTKERENIVDYLTVASSFLDFSIILVDSYRDYFSQDSGGEPSLYAALKDNLATTKSILDRLKKVTGISLPADNEEQLQGWRKEYQEEMKRKGYIKDASIWADSGKFSDAFSKTLEKDFKDAGNNQSAKIAILTKKLSGPLGEVLLLRVTEYEEELKAIQNKYTSNHPVKAAKAKFYVKFSDLKKNGDAERVKLLQRKITGLKYWSATIKLLGFVSGAYAFNEICDDLKKQGAAVSTIVLNEKCAYRVGSLIREIGVVIFDLIAQKMWEEGSPKLQAWLDKNSKLTFISEGIKNIGKIDAAIQLGSVIGGQALPYVWDMLLSPSQYKGSVIDGALSIYAPPAPSMLVKVMSQSGEEQRRLSITPEMINTGDDFFIPGNLSDSLDISFKMKISHLFDGNESGPWYKESTTPAKPVYTYGWEVAETYHKSVLCYQNTTNLATGPQFSIHTQVNNNVSLYSDERNTLSFIAPPVYLGELRDTAGILCGTSVSQILSHSENSWFKSADLSTKTSTGAIRLYGKSTSLEDLPNEYKAMGFNLFSTKRTFPNWEDAWVRVRFGTNQLMSYELDRKVFLVPFIKSANVKVDYVGPTTGGYLVNVSATHDGDSRDFVTGADWTWGDGSTSAGLGQHVYAAPGTYTASAVVYTLSGQAIPTQFTVKIDAAAATTIKVNPTTPNVGQSVMLLIETTWANVTQAVWNFGVGLTDLVASVAEGISQEVTRIFNSGGDKTVNVTLKNGNTVLGTVSTTINVSTMSMPSVTITGATSDTTTQPGAIAHNATTDDSTPTLKGTLSTPLTGTQHVNIYDGNTQFVAYATASSGTTWSFTPASPLSAGAHSFTADVGDPLGNTGARSAAYVINVKAATPTTGKLPDTGITAAQCYAAGSDAFVSCTSAAAIALNDKQDGMVGRDVTSPSNTDGKLGFSYSTVGSYSKEECVKDNITGLTWEGKPTTGLRAAGNTYTNNLGDNDHPDGVSAYVAAVNAAGLCGYSNWRLPTLDELLSIVDYGVNSFGLAIDSAWFPNTQLENSYLTDDRFVADVTVPSYGLPLYVYFGNGETGIGGYRYIPGYYGYVRLVR